MQLDKITGPAPPGPSTPHPAPPVPDVPPDATPPARPPLPPAGGQPYGPNTAAVRRFLQRLAALAPADWDAAAARYTDATGTAALVAADRALGRAMDQAGRVAERDAAVGPLVQLLQGAAPPQASTAADPDADPAEAALAALPAVAEAALAAVFALVVRDVLPARSFDALYAPFAELIPAGQLGP